MSFVAPPPPQLPPLPRADSPTVFKACVMSAIFFGGVGLFAWFAIVHPTLTCLGIGAFAGLVCGIAESGPASSEPTPSTPPSESELYRRKRRVREREIANASATGLLCGLLLGFWFFDD